MQSAFLAGLPTNINFQISDFAESASALTAWGGHAVSISGQMSTTTMLDGEIRLLLRCQGASDHLLQAAIYRSLQGQRAAALPSMVINHACLVFVLMLCRFTDFGNQATSTIPLLSGLQSREVPIMTLHCDSLVAQFGWSATTFRKRFALYNNAARLAGLDWSTFLEATGEHSFTIYSCFFVISYLMSELEEDQAIFYAIQGVWGLPSGLLVNGADPSTISTANFPSAFQALSFNKFSAFMQKWSNSLPARNNGLPYATSLSLSTMR